MLLRRCLFVMAGYMNQRMLGISTLQGFPVNE